MTKEFNNETSDQCTIHFMGKNFHCINRIIERITTKSLSVEKSLLKQDLASKDSTCPPNAYSPWLDLSKILVL